MKALPLLIICAVGVIARVAVPFHAVFREGRINFLGNDSYWYMQNARDIVASGNYGMNYSSLLALLGDYSITIPVVLAVSVIIMVYLIGRRLFNQNAGLFAAGFIAVWPGEFMGRSYLGSVDHHALEVFVTTLIACLVIFIITQKRLLTFWTIAGAGILLACCYLYSNIWYTVALPTINQPRETLLTTIEASPLWNNINYFTIINLALTGISAWVVIKYQSGWQKWVLAAWAIFATFLWVIQIRFGYYAIVPLAIMAGYLVFRIVKDKKLKTVWITAIIVIAVVLSLPSYNSALKSDLYTPSSEWHEALSWVKKNTEADALIFAWWDYGYWIEYIAEREAYITPSQESERVKQIAGNLLSTSGEKWMGGSNYLLISGRDINLQGAMCIWAGVETVNTKDTLIYRLCSSDVNGYHLVKDGYVKVFRIEEEK